MGKETGHGTHVSGFGESRGRRVRGKTFPNKIVPPLVKLVARQGGALGERFTNEGGSDGFGLTQESGEKIDLTLSCPERLNHGLNTEIGTICRQSISP